MRTFPAVLVACARRYKSSGDGGFSSKMAGTEEGVDGGQSPAERDASRMKSEMEAAVLGFLVVLTFSKMEKKRSGWRLKSRRKKNRGKGFCGCPISPTCTSLQSWH